MKYCWNTVLAIGICVRICLSSSCFANGNRQGLLHRMGFGLGLSPAPAIPQAKVDGHLSCIGFDIFLVARSVFSVPVELNDQRRYCSNNHTYMVVVGKG